MTNTIVERKVYNGWAFSENEREKGNTNYQIYKELFSKYNILVTGNVAGVEEAIKDVTDIIIERNSKYHRSEYHVIKNNTNLSDDEILLICDRGNLCFGGSKLSHNYYEVFED